METGASNVNESHRRYSLPEYTCTPEDVILTCGCSGALDLSLQVRKAARTHSGLQESVLVLRGPDYLVP